MKTRVAVRTGSQFPLDESHLNTVIERLRLAVSNAVLHLDCPEFDPWPGYTVSCVYVMIFWNIAKCNLAEVDATS